MIWKTCRYTISAREGRKVEARSRETKTRDFISISIARNKKNWKKVQVYRKLALFIIKWVGGDLESRQVPPTFIYRNFFSLLPPVHRGKDGVSPRKERFSLEETWRGNNTRAPPQIVDSCFPRFRSAAKYFSLFETSHRPWPPTFNIGAVACGPQHAPSTSLLPPTTTTR